MLGETVAYAAVSPHLYVHCYTVRTGEMLSTTPAAAL